MLLNGTDGETSEHKVIAPNPGLPNQALQVLALAQRTAEEHVASAQHHADKIRTDALAAAEQIARDAQSHAGTVRQEADRVLAEARAAAETMAREAQARAEEARRAADKIVTDARQRAEQIGADALHGAEQLKLQAQQRYDDVVGSLGAKREALQQQIEALENFDREYRGRLTQFMQGQLRALWADAPQVTAEVIEEEPIAEEIEAAPRRGHHAHQPEADAEADEDR
ncbi:Major vault protein [Actinoplanes sp. SE50]|uniref:Major vault protein n=1 Tax=unclassified Actinoplanes TaxID=2626549 RepID=UPI00023EC13C|nr:MULTISPECIES: Major vault protein [unclassified Actinoplanes]AEV86327.1 Major vault protein [Actinoplanes sp. SE50/110]ATO84724.1 Major vault protein [Actinoplanes sp. SE50]SLM02134.1 Major vault protein [Actinoplanes sp. SE50/110]